MTEPRADEAIEPVAEAEPRNGDRRHADRLTQILLAVLTLTGALASTVGVLVRDDVKAQRDDVKALRGEIVALRGEVRAAEPAIAGDRGRAWVRDTTHRVDMLEDYRDLQEARVGPLMVQLKQVVQTVEQLRREQALRARSDR